MKKMKRIGSLLLCAVMVLCTGCASGSSQPDSTHKTETQAETESVIPDTPSTGKIDFTRIGKDGNDMAYDKSRVTPNPDSPLSGKTIYWLGSSVTYGAGSNGQSMARFMASKDGANCVIEAVSGTTLATPQVNGEKSYVSRLQSSEKLDKTAKVDLFVCQISTNDAKADKMPAIGALTAADVTDPETFDLATTAGAIEFIIRYVHDTWNCPIVFYSGAHFGSDGVRKSENPSEADYGTLIDLTKAAAEKWNAQEGYDVSVLDLFNDAEFNELVSDEDYTYLMRDPVHPRKAGYLVWWLPAFEAFLENKV